MSRLRELLIELGRTTDDDAADRMAAHLASEDGISSVGEGLAILQRAVEKFSLTSDRTFTTVGSGVQESLEQSLPSFGDAKVETYVNEESTAFGSGRFVDRYDLGKEVARGGVGVINQAFEKHLRRHLVVKRLINPSKATPYVVDKFVEEAQITAQLEHPNIVPVHDLGRTDNGEIYFSMKYVSGESLKSIIRRLDAGREDTVENFSRARMLNIFQSICMAMAFAHARGIIHRDIKPANVMVGAFGETLVLDWGVAKLVGRNEDESLTEGSV
ncbi:MAG: serine/threonine protein kinase, partial [Bradymonadia bacterium]